MASVACIDSQNIFVRSSIFTRVHGFKVAHVLLCPEYRLGSFGMRCVYAWKSLPEYVMSVGGQASYSC